MDIYIWMINPSGGCKRISSHMRESLLAKGWVILPENQLTPQGNPKQMYYPNLDVIHGAAKESKDLNVLRGKQEVLEIEVF